MSTVYVNVSSEAPTPPAPSRSYWRVPRDIERRDVDNDDLRVRTDGTFGKPRTVYISDGLGGRVKSPLPYPEVYRLRPFHHVIIDCYWQKIWRELNPMLSDQKWSTLLGNKLAWTNNTGFPGKHNCITGADKDKSFPRFDIARLCSNAVVSGMVLGNKLYLDTMRIDKPIKTSEVIANRHYWYYGTSVNPKGETNYITRLGIDGKNHRVIIPVLTSQQVYINLDELIRI